MRGLLFVALLLSALPAQADDTRYDRPDKPFFQDRERGWFFYEDPPPPDVPPKPEAGHPGVSGGQAAKPAEVLAYEQFKAGMEQARIVALFNPTPTNVERYVQYRTALVHMGSQLADAGQRLVWANPQYDFTLERPPAAAALKVHDAQRAEERRRTMERLSKTHVLWFFFKSDCPYCHAFAPTLEGLARATGLKVFPVSLDGGGLPEYPSPYRDQGQAAALGASNVPALYLVNPATRDVTPVAFGMQSEMAVLDRIMAVANPTGNTYVDAATPALSLPALSPEGVSP